MTNQGKLDEAVSPMTGLVVIILTSFVVLIFINFYTLRMMSALRAYINGESTYSKAEKNASQNLIKFIATKDEKEWSEFQKNIRVPLGAKIAREGLVANASKDIIRKGLLQSGNHEEDIEIMIWSFQTFGGTELMRGPLRRWEIGDSLITQRIILADQIKELVDAGQLEEKNSALMMALNKNISRLTEEEGNFSSELGSLARRITRYLFAINVLLTLIIIGNVAFYVFKLLKGISKKTNDLENANKELDRLVYTISHDLRSPINSMMGLVGLAQRESKIDQMGVYLTMMNQALKKQETFVKETIAMSKENRSQVVKEIVDLSQVVEQVISLHRHIPEAAGIRFSTQIGIYRVFSDKHKLEVILSNLISNAIKYHDPNKSDKYIKVTTSSEMDKVRIEVADNGIGIPLEDQSKVFDMFYMSTSNEKGSGLGLYIVNEMATKLGGEIVVQSTLGEGSTFSVILKK